MRTNRFKKSLASASLMASLSLLTACAVGPNYQRPEVNLAQDFVDDASQQSYAQVATLAWWQSYDDPLLNQWVEQGLGSNLDIAVAVERIAAAQAALSGTGVNSALSGDLSVQSTRSGSDVASATTSDSASLSGNLAIDLFGGIKRERQAAKADLLAAVADTQTARLAYLSALVSAYIDARYYQYALVLTQQSIKSREQTWAVTQEQRRVGSATELEEEQVKALLYVAQADIPDLQASFMAQVYAIATLLDEPADGLLAQMQSSAPEQNDLLGLSLDTPYKNGVPADLLRNRPDVRSAEYALQSAVAEVGVAQANRLPSLNLTGTVSSSQDSWSFGPLLSLPIFNQGALAASKRQVEAQARVAEIQYRQTVLDAVEDVQSANSAWQRDREKVDRLNQAVNSYTRALDLSQQTYQVGVMTLLDLLDTDRSLASARLQYAAALRDLSVDWATLQIALGAGGSVAKSQAEN
ncbi:efflux transporter outer membrane subunit [Halioxenophilus aromaticivorans]|uniref:Efflux transporter outer membrane subunit n=2 Tax=Halioxenophilus aromaticivorans TaxID=1306992 RepID=A0AAV3U981_9ALTE